MRRANNQDSLAVALADDDRMLQSRGHLMLVADGMGAHAAGELASQIAADNIPLTYHKRSDLAPPDALAHALEDANSRINSKGQNSVDFQGMGTTCSCLALLPAGAIIAHVGDSRVYRLRGEVIEQLTFDHSLVWEMAAAGQANEEDVPAYVPKNVITRSLGPNNAVKVDLEGPLVVRRGDVYLLCSDGLTGPLNAEMIGLVIGALPPEDAAQTLVDLANLLGGPDNITVVVAKVDQTAEFAEAASHDLPTTDVWNSVTRPVAGVAYAALAAATIAAVASIYWFTSGNSAVGGAALAVAVLSAIGGWILRQPAPDGSDLANSLPNAPHGKAPYRRNLVAPGQQNIETLSDIVRQLEDLESQRDWRINWAEIHADRQAAHQAIATGDFQAAIVAYCSAVRRLMQAVRESEAGSTSGSSINLGEE